jgi:hypothetical protein
MSLRRTRSILVSVFMAATAIALSVATALADSGAGPHPR